MNQNPVNHESFLEEALHFVQQTMTEDQFVPTALLQRRNPDDHEKAQIVVAVLADAFKSPATKRQFEEVAPQLAAEFNAERVAVITEAWAYMPEDFNDPDAKALLDRIMRGEIAVSELPREQRTEIISIVMEANDGTTLGASYEIVEDPARGLGRNLNPGGYSRIDSRWKFFPEAHQAEEQSDPVPVAPSFDLESLFSCSG